MTLGGGNNSSLDAAMIALGYTGGAALSICLIPQLIAMWRTKSAGDLSLPWLILYSSGLILSSAYLIYIEAMAAWIPMIIELTLTVTTLASKLYLDAVYPEQGFMGQDASRHDASVASAAASLPQSESAASTSPTRAYGRAVSRRAADYVAELAHPSSTCPHCKKKLNTRSRNSGSGRWSRAAAMDHPASFTTSPREPLRDPDMTV